MSQEGILKYPPLLLFPLEGPEIYLNEILTKQHFTLIFWLPVAFSLPLVLKMQFLLFE